MEYNFSEIEKHWQKHWKDTNAYKVSNVSDKPKYYVLDMFPYPSGAGLHVGHPLGYIASDIFARYKRLKGFNVLHPMGYDAFGLPAEQYAIEHGIHPAVSTENNINNFRSQLDKIGFCFDWDREVKTCDPKYYKWTQWIFLQLFNSWFNRQSHKAESITQLISIFETEGNANHPCPGDASIVFEKDLWKSFTDEYQQEVLMHYRLAYCGYGEVNWCEALGTVLANDEVVNGVSERGGHPVVKKKLRQWYLRITEYADRLLQGLQTVDFSDAMKEMQTNWIGKSTGAEITFNIQQSIHKLTVYTTRPDTIFGVDFMVVAPEHELIKLIASAEQKAEVEKYIDYVKSRSDRERQAEKKITGCFTGAYAINPFNAKPIPIWISEYVLAGYGTGAIMAVPCGDERDFKFAKHFNIPITNIIGDHFNGEEANATKEATLTNSDFLNGIVMKDAIDLVVNQIETLGIGKKKINYKMRDAAFSRQRYWGEPFPIVWKNKVAVPLNENELPLLLPEVDSYSPGPEGEGPLANIKEWVHVDLTPNPSPKERGTQSSTPGYFTNTAEQWRALFEHAKANRKNATEAEDAMWQAIRNRQVKDCKFRRQHPIAGFIPDFVCLEKKLIIEIDGGYHNHEEQKNFDELRTQWLFENGYKLIRFTNEEVLQNITLVTEKISKALFVNDSSSPSPLERGLGGEVVRETNTMPGYAGSSWYFLRYMDPHNDETFCDRKVSDYWNQVDLYIGGTEHAVGHLLYSRMWTKALYDLGFIGFDEPFKKLLNQGMIQGSSRFMYNNISKITPEKKFVYESLSGLGSSVLDEKNYPFAPPIFISKEIIEILESEKLKSGDTSNKVKKKIIEALNEYTKEKGFNWIFESVGDLKWIKIPVDVNFVDGYELDEEEFRKWRNGAYADAIFIKKEDGKYICGSEVEKMSKSKFNTVNPNDLVEKYGADTFRMYEMFLGPVEQSKPWDTKGIEGVHRFIKKLWRLFFDELKGPIWTSSAPSLLERAGDDATAEELKVLHKAIKKIEDDTERFSFNTAVSAFMVCVNELSDLKCSKKEILEPLLIMLAPYAPHISEELYFQLTGNYLMKNDNSLSFGEGRGEVPFPTFNANYIAESSKEYPVSINGKLRTTINLPLDITQQEVDPIILSNEVVQKWLDGKAPKKIIFVKGKMINVVI